MAEPRRLLIVDDDPGVHARLRGALNGYYLYEAADREGAIAALRAHEPGVVLLDLGLPPDPTGVSEGMSALEAILRLAPETKVIVMGEDPAAAAPLTIAAGAYDVSPKPLDVDAVGRIVEDAFALSRREHESGTVAVSEAGQPLPGLIGQSSALHTLARTIERIAPTDVSVALFGESGTGKEVIARAIHGLSPRRAAPFVAINCAAIPSPLLEAELFGFERGAFTGAHKQTPGKVELANGGTLFLDEIGDLPRELQAKLLRFLQDRTIERIGGRQAIVLDLRIICATHHDLERAIAQGAFREDLFYRLAEVVVTVPALRDRPGDAVLLARHFLALNDQQLGRGSSGFTLDALRAIDAHPWHGNVRELQNRVKRASILREGRSITAADLDLAGVVPEPLNLRRIVANAERDALRRVLAQAHGNVSLAAKLLGVSRPRLYDLLRRYGGR
jgi:putative PEP-CTERM system response regulator